MRTLFFTPLLFFLIEGKAQTVNLSDSLRHILHHKPVPTAKFDTRNSFITGRAAQMRSIKAGVNFRKSLSLGVSYNWLKTDIVQPVSLAGKEELAVVRLRYIAPFAEYTFYRNGTWEATVPVQIGIGKSFLQVGEGSNSMKLARNSVVLYEPSMALEYKVLNVLGLGAGVGYRLMLKNNHEIEQRFTSPTYVLRIRLIFDEIYKISKKKYNSRNGEK